MKNKLITMVLTILIIIVPIITMPGVGKAPIPKVIALLTLSMVLLILMLINYKKLILDKKDYTILVFAILISISTINAIDIKTSIIGSEMRYDGIFVLLSYILIYLCSKKFFRYKSKKALLHIFQFLYIAISLFGIAQYYIELPNNALSPIFNRGTCGTFGNTNFMGNFICIGIPIFVLTYINKGDKISFISSLLVFFNLLVCHARSGWIAFGVFALMLAIYLIKNKNKKMFIRTGILIICFILIFCGIYYQKNSKVKAVITKTKNEVWVVQSKGIYERLGSGRIGIWDLALQIIPKYPLFGVGPDNFWNGIYENINEIDASYIFKNKVKPDKVHNEYLEIAVTNGIPALIIYIIFLCEILLPKLKYMWKNQITFTIISVIISYLVQAFFNISTIGVAPIFWFVLGLADNEFINKE